jgi:hypothetical protein
MKIVSYCALHYGKEYLKQAVEAVYDASDKIIILYTPKPSYGHGTSMRCPDTKDELYQLAKTPKTEWHEGDWSMEGQHRNTIYQYIGDADVLMSFDSDEVWDVNSFNNCARLAYDSDVRNHLVLGFVHFWRSFSWCCKDRWGPVRAINVKKPGGQKYIEGLVYHFGYAQRPELVKYKMDIHGHKGEIRKGWFDEVFLGWPSRKNDIHPTTIGWWNVQPFDKNTMPDALKRHPYYNMEIIV